MNLGDRLLGSIIDFTFPTQSFAGGMVTFSGAPSLVIYKANSTTEITAGITLNVDHDSRTGFNHVRIDLSADPGYTKGSDYSIVVNAGTVDGVAMSGFTIAQFSIGKLGIDVVNTALAAVPNVETASVRELAQFIAAVLKGEKVETDILQTIKKEGGGVFGTRSIISTPSDVTVGKIS